MCEKQVKARWILDIFFSALRGINRAKALSAISAKENMPSKWTYLLLNRNIFEECWYRESFSLEMRLIYTVCWFFWSLVLVKGAELWLCKRHSSTKVGFSNTTHGFLLTFLLICIGAGQWGSRSHRRRTLYNQIFCSRKKLGTAHHKKVSTIVRSLASVIAIAENDIGY